MKIRILSAVCLCGFLCGYAQEKVKARYLVDSLFFTERPSGLEGVPVQVAFLKAEDGIIRKVVIGTNRRKRDELLAALRELASR